MGQLIGNQFVMIALVSFGVVVLCYFNLDKLMSYLGARSFKQREEVIRLLDLMFVKTDRQKVTLFMLSLSFGLGFLVFLALLPNWQIGLVISAIVVVVGWSLPIMLIRNRYESRCSLVVDQMVDGLTIMGNGISAGLSVAQAMERVIENIGNPLAQEFELILSQVRLGRSLEDALVEFSERVPRPDVQMFVTAVTILKETGGPMSEVFTTTVLTIRERQKIEKQIEAMTAQGMTQAMIVSLAPFALLGLYALNQPGYIAPLFNTTLGLILFFIMVAMVVIGGLLMRRIVTIKV